MAGIQISGLLSNQAFDWKSIVDQLVAADGIPITTLNKSKDTNTQKVTALTDVQTSLQALQDSLQSIRSGDIFSARNVSSDLAGTTWKCSSVNGTAIGSYKFAVTQLATAAQITGAGNIGAPLSDSADVGSLTLATLRTATAASAGTITVNGQQIAVATTDSLQGVFDKISAATGTHVTGSYDPDADGITLASDNGAPIVLGAANDTSNFFTVMKLANNGSAMSVSSSAPLGTVATTATLANAGFATALSGGSGSFLINGVTINYASTDTLGAVLNRISQSAAGVTASYDSANDRVLLVNKTTGDIGVGATDTSGNLLAALGLTSGAGATLAHGKNALFTINGGSTLSSATNTLDASVHGISGLSVTVNSETTQTLQVESDTASMQTSLQSFIDKFNATQDLIETDTKISSTGGNVSTSILSDNREVQDWARQLQVLAFQAVAGATGSVKRISDLGIDFDGITGHLTVKDTGKLATALSDHPEDVNNFFLKGTTAFVPKLFGFLSNTINADRSQQSNLAKANTDIDTQIATLQSRLDAERESLTNSFMTMLDAQSAAQSQNTYINNTFFKNNSTDGSCWVARIVYGARNPRWLVFRHWLLHRAPGWFRALYCRHGERFAGWLADKPRLQAPIRRWMDARIAGLVPSLPSP